MQVLLGTWRHSFIWNVLMQTCIVYVDSISYMAQVLLGAWRHSFIWHDLMQTCILTMRVLLVAWIPYLILLQACILYMQVQLDAWRHSFIRHVLMQACILYIQVLVGAWKFLCFAYKHSGKSSPWVKGSYQTMIARANQTPLFVAHRIFLVSNLRHVKK